MSYPILHHFACQPVECVRSISQSSTDGFKPRGLWVSDESGDEGWSSYASSVFGGDALKCRHRVLLRPEAAILWLKSAEDIDDFTALYAVKGRYGDLHLEILWHEVALRHQGILITPYVHERRLHTGSEWYYGWDCASGCVWDAEAVAEITEEVDDVCRN